MRPVRAPGGLGSASSLLPILCADSETVPRSPGTCQPRTGQLPCRGGAGLPHRFELGQPHSLGALLPQKQPPRLQAALWPGSGRGAEGGGALFCHPRHGGCRGNSSEPTKAGWGRGSPCPCMPTGDSQACTASEVPGTNRGHGVSTHTGPGPMEPCPARATQQRDRPETGLEAHRAWGRDDLMVPSGRGGAARSPKRQGQERHGVPCPSPPRHLSSRKTVALREETAANHGTAFCLSPDPP